MNERRRQLIRRYLDGIADLGRVRPLLPYELEGSSYWLFGVRCASRDELILHLKRRGVATGVHFMPLPLHPLFRSARHHTPVALELWPTFVTLPLFADLTHAEVDYVVEALRDFDRL
jgi:perosamine synthetase